MAEKKKRPQKHPSQTEYTMTVGVDGRFYNVPTIERRSQVVLEPDEAVMRAWRAGLLGTGFDTLEEALKSAKKRSPGLGRGFFTNMGKAPQATGGRIRRRAQLFGAMDPFNPGGREPRGGGGYPDLMTQFLIQRMGGRQ